MSEMNNYEVISVTSEYFLNISDDPIVLVEYSDMACAYYNKNKVFITGKKTLQELKGSLSLIERITVPFNIL